MSRKWEAICLGVASGIWILAAPVGVVAALLSPMVFDPRQALWNPFSWIAFVLVISFWAVCLVAPYGAWVAYIRRLPAVTWMLICAPLIWLLAAIASLSFLPG